MEALNAVLAVFDRQHRCAQFPFPVYTVSMCPQYGGNGEDLQHLPRAADIVGRRLHNLWLFGVCGRASHAVRVDFLELV